MTDNPQTPEPRGLANWLLARGRHWVTTSEAVLSAAESHGFAHQRPQAFQVMTTARLRDGELGRVRIEFITSRHASSRAIQEVNTTTGTMRVAIPEVTVLDLVSFPNDSGTLYNVATIVGEMLRENSIDITRLVDAATGYSTSEYSTSARM